MTAEPSLQPSLPDFEMPDEIHARGKPTKMKSKISGHGNRFSRPHGSGDRVVALVELKVGGVGFELQDDGEVYVETLKVVDLFELAGPFGANLLKQVRSLYRTGADMAKGLQSIDGLTNFGYTDESGVVLTDAEVAERRGDGRPVLTVVPPEPCVVEYSDLSRAAWPDDFEKGAPRPTVGGVDPESGATVVDLIDHNTGESLVNGHGEVSAVAHPPAGTVPPSIGEGVAAFDAGVDGWEDPPRESIVDLPETVDFAFVDITLAVLTERLQTVVDVAHLRRLLKAERQGRGRGLKARAGAVTSIEARIAAVESLAAAGDVVDGDL